MNINRAKYLRDVISSAMQNVDDEIAIETPLLFPKWKTDTSYKVGNKV